MPGFLRCVSCPPVAPLASKAPTVYGFPRDPTWFRPTCGGEGKLPLQRHFSSWRAEKNDIESTKKGRNTPISITWLTPKPLGIVCANLNPRRTRSVLKANLVLMDIVAIGYHIQYPCPPIHSRHPP